MDVVSYCSTYFIANEKRTAHDFVGDYHDLNYVHMTDKHFTRLYFCVYQRYFNIFAHYNNTNGKQSYYYQCCLVVFYVPLVLYDFEVFFVCVCV